MIGGIDLGGTKIEARLFDGPDAPLEVRRIPTPLHGYDALLDAVLTQIDWLRATSGDPALPVGVCVPGVIDPDTGIARAANIPTTGRALAADLAAACGRAIPVVHDCMAFTFSEVHGGAGDGHRVVMGLVLGTGVGGGLCIDGALPPRHAGLGVEVGHMGLSLRAAARHGLPAWPCGCGRSGCVETVLSGTGLANLAEWKTGQRLDATALLGSTDPRAAEILDIWADIAGDCLDAFRIMLDPGCIVLGGGLSNMPGIVGRLTDSLHRQTLAPDRLPVIVLARHGDSSGARGAALLASRSC